MTKKAWIIFATICVALIGGLIYLNKSSKIDVTDVNVKAIQVASADNGNIGDHTYGNMDSKVILIEYGDYQCPGCGEAYPVLKELTEKYKDQMGFVFRNFPLTSIHPNALAAATTAEAAGLQGKFWEAHGALYENQNSWNQLAGADRTNYFVTLAGNIGVDSNKVQDLLNGDSTDAKNVSKKINFDLAIGRKAGVTGTPSLFLNGENIGDKYYLNDKLVNASVKGSNPAWSDVTAFENLILKPAFKTAGISLPTEETK